MSDSDIHDDMSLYIASEAFIIEPSGKNEVLVIDRLMINSPVIQVKANQIPTSVTVKRICGILGTLNLISGPYLLVATYRVFVGFIKGQVIWRLAGHELIPYATSLTHLTDSQKAQNDIYLSMIKNMLDTEHFYFSYTYDLSHSMQRIHYADQKFLESSLLERGDSRFIWNNHVLDIFRRAGLTKYGLPLVLGFISINQVVINSHLLSWVLISRRSVERAGTRLFCRGIDIHGHVSNYVETEQIVQFKGNCASFVQTRGSIPCFWRQTPNLKYKPHPEIVEGQDHLAAFTQHLNAQMRTYGNQVLVNLINQTGAEAVLARAYSNLVAQFGNSAIRYEAFDFHAQCKKMRWDRLSLLLNKLQHELDECSIFHLHANGSLLSSQKGVFRTNCIDCLDRTNVVQSMFARSSLNMILTKMGVLIAPSTIESAPSFEMLFKGVWADNADFISTQYSGTGALKTDFTRTGKRSMRGLFQDGVNSLTRYCKNNFGDGFRQDAMDLFLGNYIVQEGEGNMFPCPLVIRKGWKYGLFPPVLLMAVAMFFASAVLPAEYNTENLLFMLFWGSMVGATFTGIYRYGIEFVDWPKLLPPIKIDA